MEVVEEMNLAIDRGPVGFEPIEFLETPWPDAFDGTIPSTVTTAARPPVSLSEPERRRLAQAARELIVSLVSSHDGSHGDVRLVIDELRQ